MSKTLRWVFVLLPCTPGLLLLAAGLVLAAVARGERDGWRVQQLLAAGGAVLLAGLGVGAFVAWRIAHPRPEPVAEEESMKPPMD